MVGGNHVSVRKHIVRQAESLPLLRDNLKTEIGNDGWIGYGAHIIGHGAVIACRARVFADIPPYAIAVRNPARVTKCRFNETTIEGLGRVAWWNWSDETVRNNLEWFYRPAAEFVAQFEPQLR
jgi:acetyltransferase-like isoleucine patch superfamily enzyme